MNTKVVSIKILEALNERYPNSCSEEDIFSISGGDRGSLHYLREKHLVSASLISGKYSDIVITAEGIEFYDTKNLFWKKPWRQSCLQNDLPGSLIHLAACS